ncbi:response regulator [Nocardiopsis sp. FIRDI 009]|uniref:response regulator n=1 Tax=Nocardiopsis sp. FIRDI 009 TaxID=714197 RepID=UPI000E2336DA|nr:response regulator [Nocardiopsis sp. FIRDI 009]
MNALPARVLVVEDDEVIRELIRLNLELEGFEVFTAVDGQDCLDRVGHIDPHVVTLDVMMPRLDGWAAAESLRADARTRDCKLVLVTARAQGDDRRRGDRIGVDAYVTKPFDPDDLVDVIRGFVGGDDA